MLSNSHGQPHVAPTAYNAWQMGGENWSFDTAVCSHSARPPPFKALTTTGNFTCMLAIYFFSHHLPLTQTPGFMRAHHPLAAHCYVLLAKRSTWHLGDAPSVRLINEWKEWALLILTVSLQYYSSTCWVAYNWHMRENGRWRWQGDKRKIIPFHQRNQTLSDCILVA